MARRGPRSGAGDTRQEILDAAREAFAELGYDRTTVRGVAAAAAVDPAMIHHYFGSKQGLFAASVALPVAIDDALPAAFEGDPSKTGERVARLFFRVWEDPEPRAALLGQLRHAFVTGEPPPIAGFITSAVLGRVAERMTGSDRKLRAELVASHLLGVALLRYIVRMEPIASADPATLVAMVGPRIQTYLT